MKKQCIYILGIACLAFLTSCSSMNSCGSSCERYQTKACKFPIVDQCEKICNSCTFGGPACATCWACINYSGCHVPCKLKPLKK